MAADKRTGAAQEAAPIKEKALADYSVSTELTILFEKLTLGELHAFAQLAISLGCKPSDTVFEHFNSPEDSYAGADGLSIFASLRGSDLHHFDV